MSTYRLIVLYNRKALCQKCQNLHLQRNMISSYVIVTRELEFEHHGQQRTLGDDLKHVQKQRYILLNFYDKNVRPFLDFFINPLFCRKKMDAIFLCGWMMV